MQTSARKSLPLHQTRVLTPTLETKTLNTAALVPRVARPSHTEPGRRGGTSSAAAKQKPSPQLDLPSSGSFSGTAAEIDKDVTDAVRLISYRLPEEGLEEGAPFVALRTDQLPPFPRCSSTEEDGRGQLTRVPFSHRLSFSLH